MWYTSILKNTWNFENLLKYFTVACAGSMTRNIVSFNHIFEENHLKRGKYGTT